MDFSTSSNSVDMIVPLLLEARRSGCPVDSETLTGMAPTIDEAFNIQTQVARHIGQVGGFKVANKHDAPKIMAPIFAKDIKATPAMLEVPAGEDIGIELEIGFLIDKPLPDRHTPDRRDAIARCLSAVPIIEIVRTRLPHDAAPTLKLADNQINGGLVIGAPVKAWQKLSLGRVDASLCLGEDRVLDGAAEVPGGDAFENFLVLEQMIDQHCGGLQPGQVVITGSLNGLPYVRADLEVRGRIEGLGEVSLHLSAIR